MSFISEFLIALFSFFLGFLSNILLSKWQDNQKIKIMKKGLKLEIKKIMDAIDKVEKNSMHISLKQGLNFAYTSFYELHFRELFMLNENLAKDIVEFYDNIDKSINFSLSHANDINDIDDILYKMRAQRLGKKILNKL